MFLLTEMPSKRGPGSFSTISAEIPSSVRAARATTPARSPFVTHVLVPLRMYSSPSRWARHDRLRVSLPASGSDSDRQPRRSPVAMVGSQRCCCSSLPCVMISVAAMVWVFTMPVRLIHPYDSSSMTPT